MTGSIESSRLTRASVRRERRAHLLLHCLWSSQFGRCDERRGRCHKSGLRASMDLLGRESVALQRQADIPDEPPSPPIVALFGPRTSAAVPAPSGNLGPFQDLPGTWVGKGFSLLARPDMHGEASLLLQVHKTDEAMAFAAIAMPSPDRGSPGSDVELTGVQYVHQASDSTTERTLSREPGIWLNAPARPSLAADAEVVRFARTSYGDALIAVGACSGLQRGPQISSISSTPISHATQQPLTAPGYLEPYSRMPVPPGVLSGAIADPNAVLQNQIEGQSILNTTVLSIRANTKIGRGSGAIENMPFIVRNAEALSIEATFWVETVVYPHEPDRPFLQLQYSQQVRISLGGIDWPHISVATLVKQ